MSFEIKLERLSPGSKEGKVGKIQAAKLGAMIENGVKLVRSGIIIEK